MRLGGAKAPSKAEDRASRGVFLTSRMKDGNKPFPGGYIRQYPLCILFIVFDLTHH